MIKSLCSASSTLTLALIIQANRWAECLAAELNIFLHKIKRV